LSYKEQDPDLPEVTIHRVYEYPTANEGFAKRIINYLTFTFSAAFKVLFGPKYDYVLVSSPNFFSGIAGLWSRIRGSKFIFDVRDLWPDSPLDLGMFGPGVVYKILRALERRYYKKAKAILVATPDIKKHLETEKIPADKIIVSMNSVDTDLFKPQKVDREQYGYKESDFIVTYTGTHSKIQDLETIIKAAKLLENELNIKFLFVGEGETKEALKKYKEENKLTNVSFRDEKPREEIIKIMNFADIGVIPMINIPIFQQAFPTKSSEYLACGKPVIASIGGELKEIIDQKEVGVTFPAGNPEKCAEAILKLANNKELTKKMGENARNLALDFFSDEKSCEDLKKAFV
jgi:glycosyltransferase involved in cell wall biosynthesis